MSVDFSIPLNGIFAAGRNLEQAEGRIAETNLQHTGSSADLLSLSDFAADLIEVDRTKSALKANLNVISTHQEISHEILDIFA
jgi:hypothetical protein